MKKISNKSLKSIFFFFNSGQNGCTSNNGNCPQLCLPQNETSRRCVCTAGYQLKDNKCIGI